MTEEQIRDQKEEQELFKPILDLISSGKPKEAVLLKNKLTNQQKHRFGHYFAIGVLNTESSNYRGIVINICVTLELILAKILSYYFASDDEKRADLNFLVFDRMELSTKYNKLKRLIKLKHSKIWTKYSNELKSIEHLIKFRNELAHSYLDTSKSGVDKLNKIALEVNEKKRSKSMGGEIQIIYYENFERKSKSITKVEIHKFHEKIVESIVMLEKCAKEIIDNYE